ncbi:CRISPR-associated protein Cas5 [Malaciobacter sp. WC5094]
MKQAIKFRLSGDYALFKKPFANNQPQSFVIPPKTAILGMIGAIMGWSKKDYILNLPFDKIDYAVKLLTSKIKKDTVGINLMQGKSAKFTFNENAIKNPPARGQRSPTRYEFLKDIEWEIFIIIDNDVEEDNKKVHDIFFNRLKDGRFVYNPNLGMQQLFAKIDKVEPIEVKEAENITDNIYTSFEKGVIDFRITKPVAFYNELIPISFNIDRSLPKTKEMISFVGDYSLKIKNKKDLESKLYEDRDGRLYQFI